MRLPPALVAATFLSLAAALAAPTLAQTTPLKVALIEDKTGPLEAYAKQEVTGFRLGLEYATHGTNTVAGRKIEIIEKDSQTKPDVGRNLLAEAYGDDNVDLAIGGTSSAVALAMLPVAQDYKKLLIVDAAVADSITGDKWNRYIFRVDRNSSQDAISNALSIGKPGVVIATLAQDYAFGRDGIAAFKTALQATGAKLVHEEYAPPTTTDFTAPAQRIFDALAKETGDKVLFVLWAGADPMAKLAALEPRRLDIRLATGGNILPVLKVVQGRSQPGRHAGSHLLLLRHSEKPGERLAGDRAHQALQRTAGFLHRVWHGHRHGPGRGAGENQGRHRHRQADRRDGGHGFRQPERPHAVPPRGPPGAAIHVRLQAGDRSERALGGADPDA